MSIDKPMELKCLSINDAIETLYHNLIACRIEL